VSKGRNSGLKGQVKDARGVLGEMLQTSSAECSMGHGTPPGGRPVLKVLCLIKM